MISSRSNPQFKRWFSLLESSGIREHNQFLVFGEKIVFETIENHPNQILEIIIPKGFIIPIPFKEFKSTEVDKNLFNEIDLFKTRFPILICQSIKIPKWSQVSNPQGLELLVPMGDPRNLGAVIRSAAAFNVSKFILLKESASPMLPHAVRSSSGTLFRQTFFRGPSLKDIIDSPHLFALDFGGANLSTLIWPKDLRLLVGEEGPGLWQKKFKQTISIPMSTKSESLNASVAVSIALFSYFSKQAGPLT